MMQASASAPALAESLAVLCIIFVSLVPFAGAGLALINAGLGRSRSAAHSMMSSLCVLAIAALAYFICGFAWQGFSGGPAHVFTQGSKSFSWIGAQPFFLRHLAFDGSPASLAALLGMLSVGLAALIPLGSGADRWRLGACCISTAILAGWTYPLFAHWVWGGGWLAQLGANYGLGQGFVDTGGASTIQAVGGLTALSIAWILGARRGKYAHDGMPSAIPGHNSVIVVFGCVLALVGWWGLNSAGAILFNSAGTGQTVLVAINTTLSAAASALMAAAITRTRFGKPDASLTANGWIGGLAASSGACAFVAPAEAAAIGLAAGALVTFSVEWFELRMSVDDPGGAISAHAMGGLWGVLSVGLFAQIPARVFNSSAQAATGHAGQWVAQVVGIATLLGFVLPITYGLNWLLNRVYPQRVAPEAERQGMDLYELGAGAYPEFITHGDEFTEL
jgi:ammonium transporter, Amt family